MRYIMCVLQNFKILEKSAFLCKIIDIVFNYNTNVFAQ